MTSYCLNPNLILNLHTDVVLQSIITLIVNFLSIKILLHCFFDSSTISYLSFLWSEWYFIVISWKFYDLILLYVFRLTTIFRQYLLYLICDCFYVVSFIRFSACINPIYIVCYTELFILSYSLNTLFTERNSSWLIYELIKVLEIRISIVFNVSFPNNNILSCIFFFLLIIDLNFLIPAVIAQIFIPTAKRLIPTGTQTNVKQMQKLKHS